MTDLEVDYTQGKIDGKKDRSTGAIASIFGGGYYKPPSNPSRREMYNRGFREGNKGR